MGEGGEVVHCGIWPVIFTVSQVDNVTSPKIVVVTLPFVAVFMHLTSVNTKLPGMPKLIRQRPFRSKGGGRAREHPFRCRVVGYAEATQIPGRTGAMKTCWADTVCSGLRWRNLPTPDEYGSEKKGGQHRPRPQRRTAVRSPIPTPCHVSPQKRAKEKFASNSKDAKRYRSKS
jgi:hypothetical protein